MIIKCLKTLKEYFLRHLIFEITGIVTRLYVSDSENLLRSFLGTLCIKIGKKRISSVHNFCGCLEGVVVRLA